MCSLHLGDPHVSKERDRERLSKWKCVRGRGIERERVPRQAVENNSTVKNLCQTHTRKALRSVKSSESACVSGTAREVKREGRGRRANRFIFSLGNIHQNSRMNMEFSCCRHEARLALSQTVPSPTLSLSPSRSLSFVLLFLPKFGTQIKRNFFIAREK